MTEKVTLVNMVPRSRSSETNGDSETNLTVNPVNPLQIAGTAFAPPLGPNTLVYLSGDGGDTWTLNAIIPGLTGDYNVRFSNHELYGGNLRPLSTLTMQVLRTMNPYAPATMALIDNRPGSSWKFFDQPWVQAWTADHGPSLGADHLYVGANDLTIFPGAGASIDISADATAAAPAFTLARLDVRGVQGQDGPSVRPGAHRSGVIYAAFFGYRPPGGSTNSDVVVVRDDRWGLGLKPFRDLVDPGDLNPGVRVITGINTGWGVGLGTDRTGSDLALAVDPDRADHVWVAWCDVQAGVYTLRARRSTERGQSWSADLLTIPRAKNPALAISEDGRVGILYQMLTGAGPAHRWEEHVQFTFDGVRWHDFLLANTAASAWTGDYSYLMCHGRTFYGIFAADNLPDPANFPHGVRYQRNANFSTRQLFDITGTMVVAASIDPFFFKVSWPEDEREEEEEEEWEHRRERDDERLARAHIKGLKLEIDSLTVSWRDPD